MARLEGRIALQPVEPMRLGQPRHVTITGMIEADEDARSRCLERGDLFRGEAKADELHRGGLALRAGVFTGRVRLAADAEPGGFDERAVFDAAELHQSPGAALRVIDFEHHRRVELAALRDQRVVGRQFVDDLFVAAFLDIEHLVDLAPHRREILEIECRERPDLEAAALFQLGDLAPALAADPGVFVERQDVGAADLAPGAGLRLDHGVLGSARTALLASPWAMP